jgi:hypothetical protein
MIAINTNISHAKKPYIYISAYGFDELIPPTGMTANAIINSTIDNKNVLILIVFKN